MFFIFINQAIPGHKRAPSDVSMASSEEDKVPPTPSTLESVTEKTEAEPVEDRTSDKLSDEGLGTSEVDKMEEEKLNEVSASNEDMTAGLMEPNKELTSLDSAKAKLDETETVTSNPEGPVDSTKPPSEAEEDEEQKEMKKMEIQEETTHEVEDKKKVDQDEQAGEDGAAGLVESQEIPKGTEAQELAEGEEESKDLKEETTEQKVTEDGIEKVHETVKNVDPDNLPINSIDANINGDVDSKSSVEESSTEAALKNRTTEDQSEETKDEVPQESEQPKQENQSGAEEKLEEAASHEPNQVSDDVKVVQEVSDQRISFQDVSAKEDGETIAHADEVTSQDGISVQESETDSEIRMEHESPAVMKSDVEKDSDSGSSSAADSNSLDLNLSISSFLSKSKDEGSISVQVVPFPCQPL